jgi:hypothetical protein
MVDEEEGTPSSEEAASPSGALRFFLDDSPGMMMNEGWSVEVSYMLSYV